MSWHRYVLPVVFGIVFSTALAQTPGTLPPARNPTSSPPLSAPGSTLPGTRPTKRGTTGTNHKEPCWQAAGVSKSAMEQRRMIAQQTRQEVEAVCANSSLSAAQKQERIREIHQRERQQTEGLISPAQREAMHACQQSRGGGSHLGGGHLGGHAAGPCGTLPGLVNHETESEMEETPPKD
jgi:hypothetical protein